MKRILFIWLYRYVLSRSSFRARGWWCWFLGVHIKHNPKTGFLSTTQKGLIKHILETLGLDVDTTNGKFTHANRNPLAEHLHDELVSGHFNYSSVVRMLLYLAGHTHHNISYAVNCAARYMFCPKLMHKHALKRIGCYLKVTSHKVLIMKPSEHFLKIDCFPDANFAGMYGHSMMDNPVCVKSRTRFWLWLPIYLLFGNPNYNLRPLYLPWKLRLLP